MSQARNATPIHNPAIPDKLYFRIGEVARLLGVETHTLRFWESEFPQLSVGKGGTGQRLYRRRDVELLMEIKQLLYEQGYTIPGARQRIASQTRSAIPANRPTGNPSQSREAGLERIRAGLRDLSTLLGDVPDTSVEPTNLSRTPRQRLAECATLSSSGTTQATRSLHLASRSRRHVTELPDPHGPGLFEIPSE